MVQVPHRDGPRQEVSVQVQRGEVLGVVRARVVAAQVGPFEKAKAKFETGFSRFRFKGWVTRCFQAVGLLDSTCTDSPTSSMRMVRPAMV